MAHVIILAETTASISELKKNPMATVVAAGEGFPVAILNRNEPAFYCVPAKAFEALMDKLEEMVEQSGRVRIVFAARNNDLRGTPVRWPSTTTLPKRMSSPLGLVAFCATR